MYIIELSQDAQNFLNKLDNPIRERIEKSLKRLENNPFPSDVKFIGRHNGDKVLRSKKQCALIGTCFLDAQSALQPLGWSYLKAL